MRESLRILIVSLVAILSFPYRAFTQDSSSSYSDDSATSDSSASDSSASSSASDSSANLSSASSGANTSSASATTPPNPWPDYDQWWVDPGNYVLPPYPVPNPNFHAGAWEGPFSEVQGDETMSSQENGATTTYSFYALNVISLELLNSPTSARVVNDWIQFDKSQLVDQPVSGSAYDSSTGLFATYDPSSHSLKESTDTWLEIFCVLGNCPVSNIKVIILGSNTVMTPFVASVSEDPFIAGPGSFHLYRESVGYRDPFNASSLNDKVNAGGASQMSQKLVAKGQNPCFQESNGAAECPFDGENKYSYYQATWNCTLNGVTAAGNFTLIDGTRCRSVRQTYSQ